MSRRAKLFRDYLTLAVVATLLAACSCSPGPESQQQSLLNRGLGPEPESLDMHKARTVPAGTVQRDLGEGLVGYSPSGELVPAAASSWTISDDGLEYVFTLREDARWSNGDPVTAEDFVFSFRRLVDPATAAFFAQTLLDVENAEDIVNGEKPPETLGVSATGEHELTVRLRRPLPYFLGLLIHPSAFPVHPPSVLEHGDDAARPGNLVSNGAYQLVGREIGAYIDLARNEYYWDNGNTAIDRVRHFVTPEANAELNRYRAGELHITSNIPPESFARMREERPDEMRIAPKLTVYFYGFNLTKPPFKDNPDLRKALSMAIDREDLTELVVGRGETPAYSWVPPGVANYEPRLFPYADMTPADRHAAARRAYEDAGYDDNNPARIELRYNTSDTQDRIALAIQSMWRNVLGFEAKLINEEFQVLLSNMRAMEVTQVFRSAWEGDYNDPHTFLHLFESDSPSNMTGYADPEFDSLMERAASQSDPEARRLYLGEAEITLLNDHPIIPIYFYVSKHMVSPAVSGWEDNVLDYHYSRHLSLDTPNRSD